MPVTTANSPIDTKHPAVGEKAPDVSITDVRSGTVSALSDLWAEGPAVLIFLRHIGCTFCREHVAQLDRESARFQQVGAKLGLITVGQPGDTDEFCRNRLLYPAFVCLSDPDKAAYSAYGLARGSGSELINSHVVSRGFQATLHGHFLGMPKGDPFQMPGLFIVDRTGIVRYAHRHRDVADNPPNAELFTALESMQC